MFLPWMAKWQPYVFSAGMTLMILFMLGAGTLGVSRRHWDMDFTGALLAFEYPGTAYTMMAVAGIGGVLGVLGGAMYLIVTVGSLLFGKKLDESRSGTLPRRARRARHRYRPPPSSYRQCRDIRRRVPRR